MHNEGFKEHLQKTISKAWLKLLSSTSSNLSSRRWIRNGTLLPWQLW